MVNASTIEVLMEKSSMFLSLLELKACELLLLGERAVTPRVSHSICSPPPLETLKAQLELKACELLLLGERSVTPRVSRRDLLHRG